MRRRCGGATSKRNRLKKQKACKKEIRQFGRAEIPQEAFIATLKIERKFEVKIMSRPLMLACRVIAVSRLLLLVPKSLVLRLFLP